MGRMRMDGFTDIDELIDPQISDMSTTQLGLQRLNGVVDTFLEIAGSAHELTSREVDRLQRRSKL
jgi:hypothetical protein